MAQIKIFPAWLQDNTGLKIFVWPKMSQKKLWLK